MPMLLASWDCPTAGDVLMADPSRPYAEERIWKPLALDPGLLGFPGAVALYQAQIGNQSGFVDLVLFPSQRTKVVLVEAKRAADGRAAADVIGQLLKYYTHALNLGQAGVERMRNLASDLSHGRVLRSRQVSLKSLFNAKSSVSAQEEAAAGDQLHPADIELIVALDDDAPKFQPRLIASSETLSRWHYIPLSVVIVPGDGSVKWRFQHPRFGLGQGEAG